jgi:hypothetical protein
MTRSLIENDPTTVPTQAEVGRASELFGRRGRLWFSDAATPRVYIQILIEANTDQANFLSSRFGGAVHKFGNYHRWSICGRLMRSFLELISPHISSDQGRRRARTALGVDSWLTHAEITIETESALTRLSTSSLSSVQPEQKFEDIFHLLSDNFDQMETLRFFFSTPLSDGGLSSLACSAGDDSILDSWLREASLPAPAGLADICSASRAGSFLILTRRTS